VNQGVQGSPEALGPKWLTAIVFDPPAWCGVARTLCVGDVETPFLGGELLSGGGIKVTKGAWQVPKWFLQSSHEFTFGVGMNFVSYPLVLTPLV
jgi:hypothetical protein